jgi:hypothetical protein
MSGPGWTGFCRGMLNIRLAMEPAKIARLLNATVCGAHAAAATTAAGDQQDSGSGTTATARQTVAGLTIGPQGPRILLSTHSE